MHVYSKLSFTCRVNAILRNKDIEVTIIVCILTSTKRIDFTDFFVMQYAFIPSMYKFTLFAYFTVHMLGLYALI
jgi:hypothetical protein